MRTILALIVLLAASGSATAGQVICQQFGSVTRCYTVGDPPTIGSCQTFGSITRCY